MTREDHLARHRESQRLYRLKFPDRVNGYRKRFFLENPDKIEAYRERQRILMKRAKYYEKVHFGSRETVENVLKRDNYSYTKCGMTNEEHKKKWGRRITIDHKDGNGRYSVIKNHAIENLQTLCLICHSSKDTRLRGPRSEETKLKISQGLRNRWKLNQ